MKNILLSVVVLSVLIAGGVGGTMAGFVDTEQSTGNFVQAGISDLLVNGQNDPNVGAKITFDHVVPCKSIDFWIDLYNWGVCSGGDAYMHFKDVVSTEAGTKLHMGVNYVYDGVSPGDPVVLNPPPGYRAAVGTEPAGPGVWSSEPEKIAEVGGGYVGQVYVAPDDPRLMGEDYATGVAAHLDIFAEVPYEGTTGTILGNPDTNGDGVVTDAERLAWVTNGNRWVAIDFRDDPTLESNLINIECNKRYIGFLATQTKTFVHLDVHLMQIEAADWPDPQTKYWPTNALQGDIATWDMLFELITDPPQTP